MTGMTPVPYMPTVMGLPDEPDDGKVSVSRHKQFALNRMESPGLKLDSFTLASVFHGDSLLVPAFESLPVVPQTLLK